MRLPWDDPDADPYEDIRAHVNERRGRAAKLPGQPVLVPRCLKEILAGHVPDNHLVAYPESPAVVTW